MIGERELRKLLFEYLAQPHDHYVTTIIASLRYTKPPDISNFFRRFLLSEVIEVVKKLLVPSQDDLLADADARSDLLDSEDLSEEEDAQTNFATRHNDMLDSFLLSSGG